MVLELSVVYEQAMKETRRMDTAEEFHVLWDAARANIDVVVREPMEPHQPFSATVVELRDLYIAGKEFEPQLSACNYPVSKRETFRDAIRLADTAYEWFGEGKRTGVYRIRTVEEVVRASRPWRARLGVIGRHAFVFQPDIAAQFEDVNTTRTLPEEQNDMSTLLALIKQHEPRLREYGLKSEFIAQGRVLYDEAMGRDLLAILGLRTMDEGYLLRNRFMTYSVLLAHELRAAGVNACYDDPTACRRFEAASFRNALRRLRPAKRKSGGAEEPGPVEGDVRD